MKKLAYVLFLISVVVVAFCRREKPRSPVEGVWKLVSTKPLKPDGSVDRTGEEWNMMKIVSGSHFTFVEQEPGRPRFTKGGCDEEMLAAAKTFFAGGGTYTFDGTTYTETITHFFNPNYIGVSVKLTCEFHGDLWIVKGTFPSKSVGMPDDDYEMTEVYQRVE